MIQTEFEFTLPVGYQDDEGTLHRQGTMRLATAADEILPLKDARVQGNQAYLVIILLSRVITRLEGVEHINPKTIENLYAQDLAYLQDFYSTINGNGQANVPTVCPECKHHFEVALNHAGGGF